MSSKNGVIVVLGLVATALILATIPAVLNIVSRMLRAHYRRVIWRYRADDAGDERAAQTGDPSLLAPAKVAVSRHPARAEAAVATRDVQIAHGIAALVYAASVVATILGIVTLKPFASRLAMAYASLAPQLLIVLWTMRLARRQKTWVFLTYGAAGAVLVFLTSGDALHVMIWAALIALLIIPALLLLTDRVIEPFVILLLPVLFVILGLGILLDQTQPDYTRKGEDALKGLRLSIIAFGLAGAVGGFFLFRMLSRKGWRIQLIVCALAVTGVLLLNPTNDRQVPGPIGIAGVVGAVLLQLFIIGALFRFFVWLQDRPVLTNELLHIHLTWAWLTVYFELWAWMNDKFVGLRWWFAGAFVLSTVTLHLLLFLLRRRRRAGAGKRLLLLRAFGGPDEREDLLDALRGTWRRIGVIDIIASIDVATTTLQPGMLAAFVLRRTGEQFVGSAQAAAKWIAEHPPAIEGDGGYPVNAAFCPHDPSSPDAWKSAFLPLAKSADVVLMDVRNFTMAHKGCVWELETLRDENLLHRVVFLANSRTDRKSIAALLQGSRIELLSFEHRTSDERRALFDRLLDVAYA